MRDKKIHPRLTLVIVAVLLALVVLTAMAWAKQLNRNGVSNSQSAANGSASVLPDSTKLRGDTEKTKSTGDYILYAGEDGKTALEILKQKADVLTKDSDYGEYVDSINGLQGGTGGKYWTFYVNGQMAQVGAGTYQTKNGDRIEWKFE
jgi:hypothetical protein